MQVVIRLLVVMNKTLIQQQTDSTSPTSRRHRSLLSSLSMDFNKHHQQQQQQQQHLLPLGLPADVSTHRDQDAGIDADSAQRRTMQQGAATTNSGAGAAIGVLTFSLIEVQNTNTPNSPPPIDLGMLPAAVMASRLYLSAPSGGGGGGGSGGGGGVEDDAPPSPPPAAPATAPLFVKVAGMMAHGAVGQTRCVQAVGRGRTQGAWSAGKAPKLRAVWELLSLMHWCWLYEGCTRARKQPPPPLQCILHWPTHCLDYHHKSRTTNHKSQIN